MEKCMFVANGYDFWYTVTVLKNKVALHVWQRLIALTVLIIFTANFIFNENESSIYHARLQRNELLVLFEDFYNFSSLYSRRRKWNCSFPRVSR